MATHSNNKLNSRVNASTPEVAQVKAKAQQSSADDKQAEGRFNIAGDTRLTAGSSFNLTGFGRFDGKWQIQQVTHSISRSSGYTTEVQFQKVAKLEDSSSESKSKERKSSPKGRNSKPKTSTTKPSKTTTKTSKPKPKPKKTKQAKPKLVVYDIQNGKLTKS